MAPSNSFLSALLLALAATATNAAAPKITWGKCPATIPPGVDCAKINVPLAYQSGNSTTAKGNGTVELGLVRLNHTGKGEKQGSLFFNTGGPGASGALVVAGSPYVSAISFSDELRDAYDIIGLDPRGVGISTPVQCDPKVFNKRVKTYVTTDEEYDDLYDYGREIGESCANLTGPLINHLDTVHVAKDHEIVRKALGDSKFNYLGLSYGTFLGYTYASLFPGSVGRMALDAIVDHSQSEIGALLAESTGYETTLNQFFDWCDRNSTCALHGKNSSRVWDQVLEKADSKPISAPSCNGTCRSDVTGEEIRYNAQSLLTFQYLDFGSNWFDLADALLQASRGNATALSTPTPNSRIVQDPTGSPYNYLAIGCQDWLHRSKTSVDLRQKLLNAVTFAPRTLGMSQTYYYESTCIGWPAPLTNPQAPIASGIKYAPTILLAASVYDPETSITNAEGVREQLPKRGGTSQAMDRYLATGKLPRDGTVIVTSDTICPWCYVGRRQLQAAQRLWEQKYPNSNDTFAVSYQPFQLKPEWPRGPGSSVSKEKVYNEKFGKERVTMMQKHLSGVGESLGINFKYGGQTGNTRDSHRLVQLAKKHGEEAEGKALDGLFAAYFEKNEDITSYDTLKKVAIEAGIPEDEFQKSIVDSDQYGPEVDRLSEEAQFSGVSGVPDFVMQDRFRLSGANDPSTFVSVWEKIKAAEGS
ncbi:DSBA-like thioredoxin domain-containing protein [Fusarium flagelliforme]|uniref:DSBA-like thioredoxin domain-containing protein n=1 Tax=Fusarium flagelliforme TaxID=2675880 RepID=UPI001E8EDA28|nr:DSBA-like thioredoxin domain-containing protein [Fusarium flagelliforme]KAH7198447.1 DSBA-like thioredoxin domain-containing protein [Fusarium flagelliforme]